MLGSQSVPKTHVSSGELLCVFHLQSAGALHLRSLLCFTRQAGWSGLCKTSAKQLHQTGGVLLSWALFFGRTHGLQNTSLGRDKSILSSCLLWGCCCLILLGGWSFFGGWFYLLALTGAAPLPSISVRSNHCPEPHHGVMGELDPKVWSVDAIEALDGKRPALLAIMGHSREGGDDPWLRQQVFVSFSNHTPLSLLLFLIGHIVMFQDFMDSSRRGSLPEVQPCVEPLDIAAPALTSPHIQWFPKGPPCERPVELAELDEDAALDLTNLRQPHALRLCTSEHPGLLKLECLLWSMLTAIIWPMARHGNYSTKKFLCPFYWFEALTLLPRAINECPASQRVQGIRVASFFHMIMEWSLAFVLKQCMKYFVQPRSQPRIPIGSPNQQV